MKVDNKSPKNPRKKPGPPPDPCAMKPRNEADDPDPINFFVFLDHHDSMAELSEDQKKKLRKAIVEFKTDHKLSFNEELAFASIEDASRQLKAGFAMIRKGRFKAARKQLKNAFKKARTLTASLDQISREPFGALISAERYRTQFELQGRTPENLISILHMFMADLEVVISKTKRKSGPELKARLFISHLEKLGPIFEQITGRKPTSYYRNPWLDFAINLTTPVEPLTMASASRYTANMLSMQRRRDCQNLPK